MLSTSNRRDDSILRMFEFFPAEVVVWAIFDVLTMVAGGRSAGYGPGWSQWNYVRWMAAFDDAWPHLETDRIFSLFLLLPAYFAAQWSSGIAIMRTLRGTAQSIRRQWLYFLTGIAVCQPLALLFVSASFRGGGFRL